jgi:hypothetical protein
MQKTQKDGSFDATIAPSGPFFVSGPARRSKRGDPAVRPIANPDFDPALPLQTRKGAKQALRVSHNKIDELIRDGKLEVVEGLGRITRITTKSILKLAGGSDPE